MKFKNTFVIAVCAKGSGAPVIDDIGWHETTGVHVWDAIDEMQKIGVGHSSIPQFAIARVLASQGPLEQSFLQGVFR